MRKMILALAAVLAMTGTTFAAFDVNLVKIATIRDGVVSDASACGADLGVWMMQVTDVMACKLTIVENVVGGYGYTPGTNPGLVHQANYIEPGGPGNDFVETVQPSVYRDDLFGAAVDFDTHFMLNSGDVIETWSTDLSDAETNAGGNPYDLDDGYSGYYSFGMGNFTFDTSVEGIVFSKLTNPDTDLLQVVLPEGDPVWIVGIMTEDVGVNYKVAIGTCLGCDEYIERIIPEPEPGTVVMLIAGGLCLAAYCFCRKRLWTAHKHGDS